MATTKDYVPSKDADLLAWSANFSAKINASPTDFGLTAPVAADYLTKQAAFAAALKSATSPDTRGKRTIYLKDQAREALVALTRKVARQVTGTMTVTDDQRQELGLPIPKGHRTPTPAPVMAPIINVLSVDGRTVTLELGQAGKKRGKPANVASATIFTSSGSANPNLGDGTSDWQFAQNTTVTTVTLPFGPSATGNTVWITAYWANARGAGGPSATAVSVALPSGGVLPSAKVAKPTMRIAKAA